MNVPWIEAWAHRHAANVTAAADRTLSISSRLVRCTWNEGFCVAVAPDTSANIRINAVLDGLSVVLAGQSNADTVHVLVALDDAHPRIESEHLGAIRSLVASMVDGPHVRIWTIRQGGDPLEVPAHAVGFSTSSPQRWADLLMAASSAPVNGVAADVVAAMAHEPAFALYPKLSSLGAKQPWQMRLDGLEIGRVGAESATLGLASQDVLAPNEPRDSWREVVGIHPLHVDASGVLDMMRLIGVLVDRWRDRARPGSVLQHGRAEHALEAHILSGRLTLRHPDGDLRPAVPLRNGVLGAAQFPTLWADGTGPPRYLDALLADDTAAPWAVELKDQAAGGGHGAYLRRGIGQAVLYRHYIRSVPELEQWFQLHHLQRDACRAALAFPTPATAARQSIELHRMLARLFDVHVMEFERPG